MCFVNITILTEQETATNTKIWMLKNLVNYRRSAATLETATTVPVIFQPGSERQQAQIVAAASQWQMPQTAMAGYWQPQSLFKVALPAEV